MTLKNHIEYSDFDYTDIQPIIQEHIVEETEYFDFLLFVKSKTYKRLNEGVFSDISASIRKKLDFIRELASQLKIEASELVKLFMNKEVFKFFQRIGWNLKKLFDIAKKGFKMASILADTIAEYAEKKGISKWTETEFKKLDEYLKKHPKTKRIIGVGVASILIFIWLNMSFTGDPTYDFNFSDMLDALAGNVTLSSIFTGKEGIKLMLLFTTGVVTGLTFPWIGATSVQFIGGVIYSLAKKHKIKMRGV
jgi:hypothetical protein